MRDARRLSDRRLVMRCYDLATGRKRTGDDQALVDAWNEVRNRGLITNISLAKFCDYARDDGLPDNPYYSKLVEYLNATDPATW